MGKELVYLGQPGLPLAIQSEWYRSLPKYVTFHPLLKVGIYPPAHIFSTPLSSIALLSSPPPSLLPPSLDATPSAVSLPSAIPTPSSLGLDQGVVDGGSGPEQGVVGLAVMGCGGPGGDLEPRA